MGSTPLASGIILDWMHEDGYSIGEGSWIQPRTEQRYWQVAGVKDGHRHIARAPDREQAVVFVGQLLGYELDDGRIDDLGRLLSASHRSLRDDYEVSWPEADELVTALEAAEGVFGVRMVGGGGGGLLLALVRRDALADLPGELESRLGRKRPSPRLLALHPADEAECTAC